MGSDELYNCPVLGETIDFAYCYEIGMALVGLVKIEAVNDTLNRDRDLKVCEKCPHCFFKEKTKA